MRLFKCKCGERKVLSVSRPPSCIACEKCGTTLSKGKDRHRRRSDHLFHVELVETDDGYRNLTVCVQCQMTKREIEGSKKIGEDQS